MKSVRAGALKKYLIRLAYIILPLSLIITPFVLKEGSVHLDFIMGVFDSFLVIVVALDYLPKYDHKRRIKEAQRRTEEDIEMVNRNR